MAANIPFFRGKDVVFKFYQDGKPVYLAAKNWDVDENATENADGVNGEDRDRLDKVTNYFTASLDVFQADVNAINTYIAAQDADDQSLLPLKQSGAVQIRMRDGTRAAYLLQEMKMGPCKLSMSSRQEAVMWNVKLRFRYFKQVPSI